MNSIPEHEWDAGDLACGPLLLGLRKRLLSTPGQLWKLIATDPGAPADIPAFCRLTGHRLERSEGDACTYWIRSK